MATLYNADLKPLAPGVQTHAYSHATKLFIADTFRLAPKQSFLYYVRININQSFLSSLSSFLPGGNNVSSQSLLQQIETGLLAKRVDLPKYNIETKVLNAYNRKNIIQNKISYEPITITFHDDAADVVTNFWNDYYTFYYRDSDYTEDIYKTGHKYQPRQREGWGFTPRLQNQTPFLASIQLFSLHNKKFTEYELINPIITLWRHGEHSSLENSGLMENSMTVAYETVKYKTGYINVLEMPGFGTIHYDNYPSPISNSITNIYTDSGIIGALAGGSVDLARPDGVGSGRGVTSSLLDAYQLYNNGKNININSAINSVLTQVGIGVMNGVINGSVNSFIFPTTSGTPGYGQSYSTSQTYTQGDTATSGVSPYANPLPYGAVTINGAPSAQVQGSAVNIGSGSGIGGSGLAQGILSKLNSYVDGFSTRIFQVGSTNGTILIDPVTGQPAAKQITAVELDANGQIVSKFQTPGDVTGAYNPAQAQVNLVSIQKVVNSLGEECLIQTYRDGTVVTYAAKVDPGTESISYEITSTQLSSGQTPLPAGVTVTDNAVIPNASTALNPNQFVIGPGGILYSVGNTTTAQITNSIAGGAGVAAGLFAGSQVSGALNSALGGSVLGQVVSTAAGGLVGAVTGRAVNNILQPIVNQATGQITQAFNSATNNIQNVLAQWTGTGGFDPTNPSDRTNVVSKYTDDDGKTLLIYRNGQAVTLDPSNNVVSYTTPPPTLAGQLFGASRSVQVLPGSIKTDINGNPIELTTFDNAGQQITVTQEQQNAGIDTLGVQEPTDSSPYTVVESTGSFTDNTDLGYDLGV